MPSRFRLLSWAVGLACLQTGCGTFVNLNAPPPPAPPCIGPSTCFPLGGAARSALLGCFGTVCGLDGALHAQSIEEAGQGLLMAGAGTVAIVDTPLSLIGDLVTLPIAYARRQEASWATWWGDQGRKSAPLPGPPPGNAETAPEPLPMPQQIRPNPAPTTSGGQDQNRSES